MALFIPHSGTPAFSDGKCTSEVHSTLPFICLGRGHVCQHDIGIWLPPVIRSLLCMSAMISLYSYKMGELVRKMPSSGIDSASQRWCEYLSSKRRACCVPKHKGMGHKAYFFLEVSELSDNRYLYLDFHKKI